MNYKDITLGLIDEYIRQEKDRGATEIVWEKREWDMLVETAKANGLAGLFSPLGIKMAGGAVYNGLRHKLNDL